MNAQPDTFTTADGRTIGGTVMDLRNITLRFGGVNPALRRLIGCVVFCLLGAPALAETLSDDMTFAMNHCLGPIAYGIDAETDALEPTTAEALGRTPEPSPAFSDPAFHLGPEGQVLARMQAGEQRFCQVSLTEGSLDVDRAMVFVAADILNLALSGSCARRAETEPTLVHLASWDRNARGFYTSVTLSESRETGHLNLIAGEWPTSRLDKRCE
ncbi:hypothetical protein [Jannaschia pohangensis]|uniref:Uncharacterized protein n=1 Tax=Jannaschia pohangensis TaxID=390807 RepID=A0A1I3NNP0_9RHOB|nr:hypothetical protein SAMN04488095_2207 [Jannaschia pohangensis]